MQYTIAWRAQRRIESVDLLQKEMVRAQVTPEAASAST